MSVNSDAICYLKVDIDFQSYTDLFRTFRSAVPPLPTIIEQYFFRSSPPTLNLKNLLFNFTASTSSIHKHQRSPSNHTICCGRRFSAKARHLRLFGS